MPERAIRPARAAATLAWVALAFVPTAPASGRTDPGTTSAGVPRCFGAASRDREVPCENPRLRRMVTPSPDDALLEPEAPCDPVGASTELCTFGTTPEAAAGTVALYGDSHAGHYRASLEHLVGRDGLHGISLTRPGCPFSLAVQALPEPKRSQCAEHNRRLVAFTRDRPQVATVFVSQSRARVVPDPELGHEETRIRGYVDAWDSLPGSVRRVVVLRDPFYDRFETPDCVARAHRQRRDAGRVCAVSRRAVLKPDPAVLAARRRTQRPGLAVEVIDLTRFSCGARRCFPVVGGALVHKDEGHLTQTFARTLGPYLTRAYDRFARPA